MAMRAILVAGLLAAGAVAQDVPRGQTTTPPEIVVEGARPRVEAGMWEIHQWPSLLRQKAPGGFGAGRSMTTIPGWTINSCIADEGLEDAVARLLGRDNSYTAPGCSRVQIRIGDGRLKGRRSCTRLRPTGDMQSPPAITETDMRFDGTLTPTRIDVRITTRSEESGDIVADGGSRLSAVRTGDCPATAAAGRTPPPPLEKTIPALDPPETRAAPTPAPVPPPSVPVPTVAESPDDIVVVARRLRKLRLRYTSTGRRMYFCHADISSGDRRVDRIGCAIVRSCVRAGFGERGPDIACFRRKVDSLEAD